MLYQSFILNNKMGVKMGVSTYQLGYAVQYGSQSIPVWEFLRVISMYLRRMARRVVENELQIVQYQHFRSIHQRKEQELKEICQKAFQFLETAPKRSRVKKCDDSKEDFEQLRSVIKNLQADKKILESQLSQAKQNQSSEYQQPNDSKVMILVRSDETKEGGDESMEDRIGKIGFQMGEDAFKFPVQEARVPINVPAEIPIKQDRRSRMSNVSEKFYSVGDCDSLESLEDQPWYQEIKITEEASQKFNPLQKSLSDIQMIEGTQMSTKSIEPGDILSFLKKQSYQTDFSTLRMKYNRLEKEVEILQKQLAEARNIREEPRRETFLTPMKFISQEDANMYQFQIKKLQKMLNEQHLTHHSLLLNIEKSNEMKQELEEKLQEANECILQLEIELEKCRESQMGSRSFGRNNSVLSQIKKIQKELNCTTSAQTDAWIPDILDKIQKELRINLLKQDDQQLLKRVTFDSEEEQFRLLLSSMLRRYKEELQIEAKSSQAVKIAQQHEREELLVIFQEENRCFQVTISELTDKITALRARLVQTNKELGTAKRQIIELKREIDKLNENAIALQESRQSYHGNERVSGIFKEFPEHKEFNNLYAHRDEQILQLREELINLQEKNRKLEYRLNGKKRVFNR